MYGRIYKLTNKLNRKSYIGLTTKTISERFKAHCERGNVEKSVVQRAIKKYGKENFEIIELDMAFTKEELSSKEIFWISEFNTFSGYGYNLTIGGEGISKMSQEVKDKISKSKKGKKNFKLKGRSISRKQRLEISRTLGGKSIRMYNEKTDHEIILEVSRDAIELGFNPSNIVSVCRGKRPHTKGYKCTYISQGNPDLIVESNNSTAVQRIGDETRKENISVHETSTPQK